MKRMSKELRQIDREDRALRTLRDYKRDLDAAIAAFTVYAATHGRYGSRIEFPIDRRPGRDRHQLEI